MLRIRKIDKIRSKVIREKTKVTDALKHALTLKWQWAGHIARFKDKRWTLVTTKWKGPTGKRKVGRPKQNWSHDIVQIAGKDWINKAMDREGWRRLGEAYTREGATSPHSTIAS